MAKPDTLLSVVVPIYNEAPGLGRFNDALVKSVGQTMPNAYEIIYVNDGSTDDTASVITNLASKNKRVRLLSLSRNFGKEVATTAGLHAAAGKAIITIDGDGQHPPELIADFVKEWRAGNKVVIGLRVANRKEGLVKKLGSRVFYKLANRIMSLRLEPGATDFRLIDRAVQQEFTRMTERNRITRGLIDWLGYKRAYIEFQANPRLAGEAGYSFRKLSKLAVDSVISLSISPLYISAYVGGIVLPSSTLIGLSMIIDGIAGDPLGWHVTGSAYLVVVLLFLVGILLVSQGIIGLYLSHIHTETQNRPLYVIDDEKTINI